MNETARARDATLAVLAQAAIDWAAERRDGGRVGRLRAELDRLERGRRGAGADAADAPDGSHASDGLDASDASDGDFHR
ncbi:hypothetical protein ASG17_05040 [Brevundimonas sp. Leaf363]|uniref:hypothetical protein n=1 Tax=Brevundimonas sp. Leaf363 TaxID=1736353 RepID=UPI0006F9012C|nr:hypothetical protein [Brevundimonas sp. Leaf363]KQS55455.1 hypothetical protein ASG17_05040 [Brevundimonas sp. Leaf363]